MVPFKGPSAGSGNFDPSNTMVALRTELHTFEDRVSEASNQIDAASQARAQAQRAQLLVEELGTQLALVEAAKIYRKHLNPFVLYDSSREEHPIVESPASSEFNQANQQSTELWDQLDRPLSELELSVRARNCLDGADLRTIRDLVSLTEAEVMNLKNLGKTSLTEIKTKLSERGLSLGMPLE